MIRSGLSLTSSPILTWDAAFRADSGPCNRYNVFTSIQKFSKFLTVCAEPRHSCCGHSIERRKNDAAGRSSACHGFQGSYQKQNEHVVCLIRPQHSLCCALGLYRVGYWHWTIFKSAIYECDPSPLASRQADESLPGALTRWMGQKFKTIF